MEMQSLVARLADSVEYRFFGKYRALVVDKDDPEFPIWVGTFWSKPDDKAEVPTRIKPDGTTDDSAQRPPTRKIIKTTKGHTLQFEDADGEEMVILKEATNGRVVTLDKTGIAIDDGAGNRIEITSDAFKIVSAVPFTIEAKG